MNDFFIPCWTRFSESFRKLQFWFPFLLVVCFSLFRFILFLLQGLSGENKLSSVLWVAKAIFLKQKNSVAAIFWFLGSTTFSSSYLKHPLKLGYSRLLTTCPPSQRRRSTCLQQKSALTRLWSTVISPIPGGNLYLI